MPSMENAASLATIKAALRNGPCAWPGGYPLYFVMSDGAALSFQAAWAEWRNIVSAHLRCDETGGWMVAGIETNLEDPDLFCAHTGQRIPSAYAEDEFNV